MSRRAWILSISAIMATAFGTAVINGSHALSSTDEATVSPSPVTILDAGLLGLRYNHAALFGQSGKPTPQIATVDVARVQAEFKARTASECLILRRQQEAEQTIDRRTNMRFLSASEHGELDVLLSKAQLYRDERQKARIQALTEKSARLDKEYREAKERTASGGTLQDFRQLQRLDRIKDNTANATEKMRRRQREELQALVDSELDKLLTAIKSAVKRVAQAKGITTVMNSSTALAESARGPDITNEVIAELNKQSR